MLAGRIEVEADYPGLLEKQTQTGKHRKNTIKGAIATITTMRRQKERAKA